jgi:hypothetical protein
MKRQAALFAPRKRVIRQKKQDGRKSQKVFWKLASRRKKADKSKYVSKMLLQDSHIMGMWSLGKRLLSEKRFANHLCSRAEYEDMDA